jgi:hypothetical protein
VLHNKDIFKNNIFYMPSFYSFFTKIFAVAFLVSALALVMIPSVGFAASTSPIPGRETLCGGKCPITGDRSDLGGKTGIGQIILDAASFLTYLVGAISVLFLVYGGFLYVTDTGDDASNKKAKKILVNAVVGLIIAIVAGTIVAVVGNIVQGDFLSKNPTGG